MSQLRKGETVSTFSEMAEAWMRENMPMTEPQQAAPEDAKGSIAQDSPAKWRIRGGWTSIFPHCPYCASYALYRENNIGDYECLTCRRTGIEESTARQVM
uniref:Uncharacterized protein n=1 Tax=mine drainage metagenome TaxID=410659 RepID=E6QIE1_9ZZZZ